MNKLFSAYEGKPIYIQLYMYYRDMIINGTLKYGDKLPSIRKCATEFNVSKLTVENAYLQLSAEGYVIPKSQSGYYVAQDIDLPKSRFKKKEEVTEPSGLVVYDFSGSSSDNECFDFKLWQKYIKNAIRCEERLLTYSSYNGEYDLRKALSEYATKQRGVVCTPSQVVIGASVQNLIQILCSLDSHRGAVIFTGNRFRQGEAIFEDYGYRIYNSIDEYDGKYPVSFIYTSPSQKGDYSIMGIPERIKLLKFAGEHNCVVIEDDFDSEFCYFAHPMSSLQGLDGGTRVAYIGTMSRLLLPSIRISFMVLPEKLVEVYKKRGCLYNQTASKTEQIALARYITDDRLVSQIKKARKIYEEKTDLLKHEIEKIIKPDKIKVSGSGFVIGFDIKCGKSIQAFTDEFRQKSIKVKRIEQLEQNKTRIFVSSAGVSKKDIICYVKMLKYAIDNC